MSTTNLTPGWYPDPSGAPRKMYYDGEAWIDAFTTPPADQTPKSGPSINWNWAVMVPAVIGLIMSMQSTSLLNGTGNIWLGVALVAVAVAAAFIAGADSIVKTITAILLVLALGAALYMEDQMSQKRHEISDRLSHITDSAYRS